MKNKILSLIILLVLSACTINIPYLSTDSGAGGVAANGDGSDHWWQEAVFYEIFLRSYYDSNGDGIGDINGLTEKLDYLNDGDPDTSDDLGITAIWLMPIHPSPSYHGYDVINYYAINPEYGTMQDFQRFLDEAHSRGIHVIMDLVINHTSSQNPFFISASAGETSQYFSWYVWSDTTHGRQWYPRQVNGIEKYYYGYFCDCMPDLNYLTPEVTVQMEKITSFWLNEIGVDGFRIDAAKHLIEDGDKLENTPATHAWFKEYYQYYKNIQPDAFVIGEVAGNSTRQTTQYADREMDMIFNFEFANAIMSSVKAESNSSINSGLTFIQQDAPDWRFGTFLTNHDQNRVMSVLDGSMEKAKIAATILLTSPGTPFIYYGEEIGMQGVKPDEDIRLPMRWSAAGDMGFTSGEAWRNPQSIIPGTNVAQELLDSNSLLRYYQFLIRIRGQYPALSRGSIAQLDNRNRSIYATLRVQDPDAVLILINLSENPVRDISLRYGGEELKPGDYVLNPIYGGNSPLALKISPDGLFTITPTVELGPHQIYLYHLDQAAK
jgi:glycosidase